MGAEWGFSLAGKKGLAQGNKTQCPVWLVVGPGKTRQLNQRRYSLARDRPKTEGREVLGGAGSKLVPSEETPQQGVTDSRTSVLRPALPGVSAHPHQACQAQPSQAPI